MSPQEAANFLFRFLSSVPDGVVAFSVARSSLLPACTIHFSRLGREMQVVTSDDLASALEKMREIAE